MTLKPIHGFKFLQTHHCVTGSIRHIYEFNQYPISEELLLGLGAGVGFLYWHMQGTDPFYGGRTNVEKPGEQGLEITIGHRTGVGVQSIYTTSSSKAEKILITHLEAGRPVMVLLDMGFLPYLNLPEGYHFGYHAVVVCGYDPEKRQVLIADRDGTPHQVTLEDLARARGSNYKPFPPQNHWYEFDFTGKRPPQPDEIRQAIREVVRGMLEPPIANFGVKGIRKAKEQTLKWPRTMDQETLRRVCFNIYVFIDAMGGTGGGIFRYMYGRFLKEAGEITEEARLGDISEELRVIGDLWQGVAAGFKSASEIPDPAPLLPEIVAPLTQIADREQAAWIRLGDIVG